MKYNAKKDNTPICLALGFFDSLHKGHAAVIGKAVDFARLNHFSSAVFTFDNNPFKTLGKETRLVYTFGERCGILKDMGADIVLSAEFTADFMSVPAEKFLEALTSKNSVKYISCGCDYTFGRNSEGNAGLLKEFCGRNGIALEICPDVTVEGIKASSTCIRAKIAEGDIETANKFLTAPFSISGRVAQGRGVGRKVTYPTANITLDPDKEAPGSGVYASNTDMEGKKYPSITNAGAKPTFGVSSYNIETYIFGVNTDLYGQYMKVEFLSKIRDVMTFPSAEQLKEQIKADIKTRMESER